MSAGSNVFGFPTPEQLMRHEHWRRACAARVTSAITELVEAAEPEWQYGDGHGGAVMGQLQRALLDAGLTFYRPGPWTDTRRRFDAQRMKIRAAIVDRDGEACDACGVTADLHVDHKIPVCAGGSNQLDNLHLLCAPCNTTKGTLTWAEFITDLEAYPDLTGGLR